jgi:hypothetical protein
MRFRKGKKAFYKYWTASHDYVMSPKVAKMAKRYDRAMTNRHKSKKTALSIALAGITVSEVYAQIKALKAQINSDYNVSQRNVAVLKVAINAAIQIQNAFKTQVGSYHFAKLTNLN